MFELLVKRLSFLLLAALCLQLSFVGATSAAETPAGVKELNFVFLHGAAGNACGPQLLSDCILEQIPQYILNYEEANPGIKVHVNTLNRCYPSDVDVDTWAHNIADSVDKYLPGKGDIILIGHSMGGKSALYAVAKNIGGLADRVALVVTINSPIKRMDQYQIAGGGSPGDYCRAWNVMSDHGVCASVTTYDSSEDGLWVSQNKHWLAFISGEDAPLSSLFDYGNVDPYPKDMDDGVVPISAQYADGADVVYYGEHGHSDFHNQKDLASSMADEILRYIFGGSIGCSVLYKSGTFGHHASGLLGTDYWQDIGGDILGLSGRLWHKNNSYINWQEWEDVLVYEPPTYEHSQRTRYEVNLVNSSSMFTGIRELRWLEPDNPYDFRVYIRTSAAPRYTVQVDWKIYRQDLLPPGMERDHYEVSALTGSPLTGMRHASWATDNPKDIGVRIWSEAERPFRWFQGEWKVFNKESRQRKVIDEIRVLPEAAVLR
jgi:pimeloyl-ACP methyl ester carboxylesterase